MDIAIIGMAGRFPSAADPGALWQRLKAGAQGYQATFMEGARDHLRIDTRIGDIRLFEPAFFGISEGEAQLMDPQHRILLECAQEALDDAGYDPWTCAFPIGVFAGSGFNHYLMHVLEPDLRRRVQEADDPTLVLLANEKDFLASRISYRLGLRGPSVTVQTACSTSMVAVHLACQSLRTFEAEMCLAGGVSIDASARPREHVYRDGGILSRDGRCRPFDASASGTAFADGAALVVLKRAEDAVRDRDAIYAVLKGTSINNDGATKVGYTAPSVEQYAALVQEALAVAGVDADTIGYQEAHGTGTRLGDAVEIRALTEAFRKTTARQTFCALGSVKSQVGHLDAAAGVTGLIAVTLGLNHGVMPPTLHFEAPNPVLDSSPFFVNTQPRPWPEPARPRRAAVSSLGIGGTNAYAIVEEAPAASSSWMDSSEGARVIVLSARSDAALQQVAARLFEYWRDRPAEQFARIAYTLQVGRRHHAARLAIVASGADDAIGHLEGVVAGALPASRLLGEGRDHALDQVARAYVEGKDVDWPRLWAGQSPGRAHLPAYPFERHVCWFQPRRALAARASSESDSPAMSSTPLSAPSPGPGLFMPHWTRVPEPATLPAIPSGQWLFIGPRDGLAMEAAGACETLGLTVRRGVIGHEASTDATIDPSNDAPVRAFLRASRSSAGCPAGVVFEASPVTNDTRTDRAPAEPEVLQAGRLARLLCETWPGQRLHLVTLATGVSEPSVRVGELPHAAPVTAAALVGAAEYPALRARCVDVADPAAVFGGAPQPARRFLHELLRHDGADLTVFANGYVWERDYVPLDRAEGPPLLRADGVYLITGGLGGVGLELAEYLAAQRPVRLALVTRRSFTRDAEPVAAADRDVEHRLGRIEAAGSRVEIFSADVSDAARMREVEDRIRERWGPVNGIFHAAGLAGGALMHNASSQQLARIAVPKVAGAQVLARVFAGRDLDFLLLFSSTAAVFPSLGQLEYTAANMSLDALAPVLRRDYGVPACSVNWPLWAGVGMAAKVDTSQLVELGGVVEPPYSLDRAAIRTVLDAWSAGGWPAQVVVSRRRPEARSGRIAAAADERAVHLVPRQSDRAAAEIKAIWLDLLGSADVGDDVDFFEQGGDSIMAVQLIGRFRQTFGVEYSFDRFFDASTIRDMVAYLREVESGSAPAHVHGDA